MKHSKKFIALFAFFLFPVAFLSSAAYKNHNNYRLIDPVVLTISMNGFSMDVGALVNDSSCRLIFNFTKLIDRKSPEEDKKMKMKVESYPYQIKKGDAFTFSLKNGEKLTLYSTSSVYGNVLRYQQTLYSKGTKIPPSTEVFYSVNFANLSYDISKAQLEVLTHSPVKSIQLYLYDNNQNTICIKRTIELKRRMVMQRLVKRIEETPKS